MNNYEEDPENLGQQGDQQSLAEFLKLFKDKFDDLLRTRLQSDRIVNNFQGVTIHNLVINGNMNKNGTEYYQAGGKRAADSAYTDEVVIEAVKRCQPLFWASSAWAVVYRILQTEYGESRSVSQFEADMEQLTQQMDWQCSTGTIAMALRNNAVLRDKPEAWKRNGAMTRILVLKEDFGNAMEEVMKANL